jgi:23S rRNA U2552 (ribose-2'-O)-methylase RlmE/FtsJ
VFHNDYPYLGGITKTLANNLKNGAKKFVRDLNLPKDGLAVDLGSNDGTFLKGFKEEGMKVLGVEPTDIAQLATSNGVNSIQEFFTEDVAKKIVKEHGNAAILTAANMFAHVASLGNLMRGAEVLLDEGSFFVTESHYLLDIQDTLQFDSIYHEHLKSYSLKDLVFLFHCYDFKLVDAERIPNYGGSIRGYAQKGKKGIQSKRLKDLLLKEQEANLYNMDTWETFKSKVFKARSDCRHLISNILYEGKSICGIGCPGRSSTLLSFYGLTSNEIPYIAEQSSCLKVGLYCAGQHIPVLDEEKMFEEQPDYALMLSWHYSEQIIENLRKKGLKSKIIIPLPNLKIVD